MSRESAGRGKGEGGGEREAFLFTVKFGGVAGSLTLAGGRELFAQQRRLYAFRPETPDAQPAMCARTRTHSEPRLAANSPRSVPPVVRPTPHPAAPLATLEAISGRLVGGSTSRSHPATHPPLTSPFPSSLPAPFLFQPPALLQPGYSLPSARPLPACGPPAQPSPRWLRLRCAHFWACTENEGGRERCGGGAPGPGLKEGLRRGEARREERKKRRKQATGGGGE